MDMDCCSAIIRQRKASPSPMQGRTEYISIFKLSINGEQYNIKLYYIM